MTASLRQAALARFLDDRSFEAEVRGDPAGAAARARIDVDFARWLAALEPRRVESFRKSRQAKAARRRGERPPARSGSVE